MFQVGDGVLKFCGWFGIAIVGYFPKVEGLISRRLGHDYDGVGRIKHVIRY